MSKFVRNILNILPARVGMSVREFINPNYPPIGSEYEYSEGSGDSTLADTEIGAMFANHGGYETVKWQHYLRVYERLFSPYTTRTQASRSDSHPLRFLEIGVREGGSLQVFSKYFGPDAVLFGVDIDESCRSLNCSPAQIRIGSQSDPQFLQSVVAEMGGLDIVLDDGSHYSSDQAASFATLWPLLSVGGLYVVEDVHTSYWREFGGGYKKKQAFAEFAKDTMDGMHRWYSRHRMVQRNRFAKTEVGVIYVFDSIIAFEKDDRTAPRKVRFGSPSIK